MTVAELIQELEKIPPHKVVYLGADEENAHGQIVYSEREIGSIEYRGPDVLLEAR